MKNLVIILALFLIGCASTQTHSWSNEVATAEKEWAAFVANEVPNAIDVASVNIEKNIYLDALKSGDKNRINLAAKNYVSLIYNIMIPPLPEGSIYNGF